MDVLLSFSDKPGFNLRTLEGRTTWLAGAGYEPKTRNQDARDGRSLFRLCYYASVFTDWQVSSDTTNVVHKFVIGNYL